MTNEVEKNYKLIILIIIKGEQNKGDQIPN